MKTSTKAIVVGLVFCSLALTTLVILHESDNTANPSLSRNPQVAVELEGSPSPTKTASKPADKESNSSDGNVAQIATVLPNSGQPESTDSESPDKLWEDWATKVHIVPQTRRVELSQLSDAELESLSSNNDHGALQELAWRSARRGDFDFAIKSLEESVAHGSIGAARMLVDLYRQYPDQLSQDGINNMVGAYVWHRVAVSMGDMLLTPYNLFPMPAEVQYYAELRAIETIAWVNERYEQIYGERLPYVPHPPPYIEE